MINRTLIRTKVLQILYAHHQKGNKDLRIAENELNISLQKTYYLYHYFLLLFVKFTEAEQKKLDKQHLYSHLSEEQYINRKLANNLLEKELRNHIPFTQFSKKHSNWLQDNSETDFIELLLNEIKQSDNYTDYIFSDNVYKNNYKFWKAIFEQIILKSQTVSKWLEEKSIYWNDDLETITILVLKTIKQFQNKPISELPILLPIFKDHTTQEYAIQLLRSSIIEAEKNSNLINIQMKNWDKERIALLDLIIMQMALAEINNFPTIPLKVTLNEYINLARYYSTPKSTSFINGVLQAIVFLLKINKN